GKDYYFLTQEDFPCFSLPRGVLLVADMEKSS
ncbi:hypothetical protein Ga0451573_003944, partial [Peptococcaceae bacterium DYL19]|nr:hypothetical protein [Phosphitispora fastidiosa]